MHAEKTQSLGHLAAGIAHDFNNLLAGMLGFTELSLEILQDPDKTENIKKYLSQVMSTGTRAKELISQMLLFSRQSPDTTVIPPPAPTLVKPVLAEVVHLARSSLPSSIVVDYQMQNEQSQANIQAIHLHQIILNLIINARDAIGQFGKIEIKQSQRYLHAECCSCHKEFKGNYIELSVLDTGCGIPAHQLTNIFKSFYTTKEIGKGTGMGLSLVHTIVHSMDGHVLIESQESVGTIIHILLPKSLDDTKTTSDHIAEDEKHTNIQLHNKHIMIIDDEIAMTSLLSEFLSYYGADVFAYNKPDKALAYFIRNPNKIDLLITDATMPGISGLELSRAILQLRANLPILLCTGYSSFINEDIAYRNGITGFMLKPFHLPDILQWIVKHLIAEPGDRIQS